MTEQFESSIEKFTTKAVCKKIGCKENEIKDTMKRLELEVYKDEFGNRWFTEADVEKIKESMRIKKADSLIKILSKELEKEPPSDIEKEKLSEQAQYIINQVLENLGVELNNALSKQSETFRAEVDTISDDNKAILEKNNSFIINELSRILNNITAAIKNESENLIVKNMDCIKNLKSEIKLELKNTLNMEFQTLQVELGVINKQNTECKKNMEDSILTAQNTMEIQLIDIKRELSEVHKQNENFRKKVEELTKMIEVTQEGHFKAVDERLHQLIESNKRRGLFRTK